MSFKLLYFIFYNFTLFLRYKSTTIFANLQFLEMNIYLYPS